MCSALSCQTRSSIIDQCRYLSNNLFQPCSNLIPKTREGSKPPTWVRQFRCAYLVIVVVVTTYPFSQHFDFLKSQSCFFEKLSIMYNMYLYCSEMRNHCLLPGPGASSTVKQSENILLHGSTPYSLRSVMCTLGMCIVCSRCLMVSTDQADPSCFYFRISWGS